MTNSKTKDYSLWLVFSAIVISLCGSFLFGYAINGANPYQRCLENLLVNHSSTCPDINDEVGHDSDNQTNAEKIIKSLMEGIPQTIFVVGSFIGAITAGLWSRIKFYRSRKVSLTIVPLFYLGACICSAIGYRHPSASGMLYFGRLLAGYAGGISCVIVPTYLHEISTPTVAEKIKIIHQLFITIGIFFGEVTGHMSVLGFSGYWIYAYTIGIIPSLLAMCLLPFIPDSPMYLAVVLKDEAAARKALCKLRGTDNVDDELEQYSSKGNNEENVEKLSLMAVVKDKQYRWPLITSSAILLCQTLSGINAVFFYSNDILKTVNSKTAVIQAGVLIIGGLNVLFTFTAFPIIHVFGMRKTLKGSMAAIVVVLIILVILIQSSNGTQSALQYSIIVFIVIFVFLFGIGLGPIAFMYPSDVFPPNAVDAATSIGLCLNNFGNLLVALLFPAFQLLLQGYVFLLFAIFVALTLALLMFKMQESATKLAITPMNRISSDQEFKPES